MLKIGVRALKNQLTQIVRAVHEEYAEYVITVYGKPVAVLRPFTHAEQEHLRRMGVDEELKVIRKLAEQIGAAWVSPKSALDMLDEVRDER